MTKLKKYILQEEMKDLECPLCHHPIKPTGNVGHGCYLDSDRTDTKIYWCEHCFLEVLIPTEKWRAYQRRQNDRFEDGIDPNPGDWKNQSQFEGLGD